MFRVLWVSCCLALAPHQQFLPDAGASTADWVTRLGSQDAVERTVAYRYLFAHEDIAAADVERALENADTALLERLLALLSEWDDPAVVAVYRSHPHPAVRRWGARALARTRAAEGEVGEVLRDPSPAVPLAFLTGISSWTIGTRQQWVERHWRELLPVLDGRDADLRRAALLLLCVCEEAEALAVLCPRLAELSAAERDLALNALCSRTPDWPRELVAPLLAAWEHEPEAAVRCLLLRRRWGAPGTEEGAAARAAVDAALSLTGPEQVAAEALLGLLGPAAGEVLADRLPLLGEEPGVARGMELLVKLQGPRARDTLIALLRSPEVSESTAREALGILPWFAAPRTAEQLETAAEHLPAGLQEAVVETARSLPECEARDRILLAALREPAASLRAFETLAGQRNPAHVGLLADAIAATPDATQRGRMTQMLADSYGGREPGLVLDVILELIGEGNEVDRRAALSAIPAVVPAARREEVAAFLVQEFADTEPERLLLALESIGGATAERTFRSLASRFLEGGEAGRHAFLLSHAAGLDGELSRRCLLEALDSTDLTAREQAFRALVHRGDAVVSPRALEILTSLDVGRRVGLLRDLRALADAPGSGPLLASMLASWEDHDSRLAVLELVASHHRSALLVPVLELAAQAREDSLRFGALEALGRLGGAEAVAFLEELLAPVLATPPARLAELTDEQCALARAAALALATADPSRATRPLAEVLVRNEGRRSLWLLERWIVEPDEKEFHGDPTLARALGAAPTAEVQRALELALERLRPLDALLPERFHLETADALRALRRHASVVRWLEAMPARIWPAHSLPDLEAQLRLLNTPRARLRGDFSDLEEEELRRVPAILSLFAHRDVPQRFAELYFGSIDPVFDWHPQGILRTLSALAEGSLDDAATLWRARKEAGRSGVLLSSLSGIALDVDLDLALHLAQLAVDAAPFSPPALEGLAWIHHLRGESAPRDALLRRADEVVASGLAEEQPAGLLRRALYRATEGDPGAAAALLERALSANAALAAAVRSDALFAPLLPFLPAR